MSSQPSPVQGQWRFGPFEFDASSRELRKNGLRIHIQDQPARILEALITRSGDVVSREDLHDLLWPADTYVEFERGLNTAVAKLRQALSDSADHPRYVETVARRGYRFIARVDLGQQPQTTSLLQPDQPVQENPPVRIENRPSVTGRFWLALVASIATIGCVGYIMFRTAPPPSALARVQFVVSPPFGTRIHPVSSISPDGRKLAFVAEDGSGRRDLWIRTLSSETALRLEHTEGALAPFFSPDSASVGFFAGGMLKRIPVTGGEPRTLCSVTQPAGGSWNRDGVILFAQSGRLYQIPDAGGPSAELPRPHAAPGESRVEAWPHFLQDGRHFLVSTGTHTQHINWVRAEVFLGQLDSPQRRLLVNARSRAAFTPDGQLLFRREEFLVAQPFDLNRGQPGGPVATVAQNLNPTGGEIVVDVRPGLSVAVAPATFSVSDNGVLAFHSSPPNRRQLVWFNRKGERQGHAGEPRDYMQMALSPDGQHVVLTTRNRRSWLNWNLEILKLATNVLSQLSSGDGRDADPIWSPDSSRVVYGRYVAHLGEQVDLMEVKLGDSASTRLYGDGQSNKPETWSGDGRFLIVRRNEQFPFRLPLSGGGRPADLFVAPHFRSGFRFSPSGQWLAYSSYESGVAEVYVCRYPEMKPTIQVSTGGGLTPVWRGDGRELFYMTPKGVLVSLKVDGGSRLNFGPPTELFRTNARNIHMRQFGVTDDGQRFLVLEALPSEVADERLVVMTDWHQAVMP